MPDSDLTITLTDPADLFNAPPVDPMSPSPVDVLGVSGVDYVLGLLHNHGTLQRAKELKILLPPDKAAATSAEQLKLGVRRVAEARIERDRREIRATHRAGWRILVVALVILAVCIAISHVFGSDLTEGMRPLIRKTFEYGFEIIGWVVMWNPIDFLVFTPLVIRHRVRALQALAAMDVAIQVDERQASPVSSAAV
jgi:hypothetical protein